MTDAPALPSTVHRSTSGAVPTPAPVSPTVRLPEPTPGSDLHRLMTAFRMLQTEHARVLQNESLSRGLNTTDTRFLFFLAEADGEGVTPKQASEYLELSTGAMTSLIDRLEKRAHIERRPNPLDRRSILLHLTASGASVAREIGAVWTDAFRDVVAPVDRGPLADTFDQLGTALGRHTNSAEGRSAA